MNDQLNLTRRQFLQNTGKAATTLAAASAFAPALLAAKSPNETIGVGCIGLGTRGGDLINAVVAVPGVKVVAVCDVYGPHRQKGIERSRNPDVKAYVDYRELLADTNVDAVVIATPDHWHCQIVVDAAKAGKDIYCEKGFSHTLPEAKLHARRNQEEQDRLSARSSCAAKHRRLAGERSDRPGHFGPHHARAHGPLHEQRPGAIQLGAGTAITTNGTVPIPPKLSRR